jgi:Fur family ferric uptake transcriptional regulator
VHTDPSTQLRDQGIYVTAQRLAVLRVVDARPHTTAEAVLQGVRDEIGSISRQSVYDTLNTLSDLGVLRRIQPTGSPALYETRTGDNHHHLICRGCGRVADVDCAVGERPCLTASDAHGFDVDEAEVVYWGRCPACRQEAESASPVPSHPRLHDTQLHDTRLHDTQLHDTQPHHTQKGEP